MRAVPSLRDLDILIAVASQHHLDALALQQRAQPQGEVKGDVLLHDASHHDAWIPELGGVAGGAAAVSRVDRDHVGRGHDECGLRSRCPSRWNGRKQDDPGREHGREARETQLPRSIRPELTLVGGIGEQGDVTGALERDREATLMTSAGSRHATGQDLAPLTNEAAKARDLLVVDEMDLLHTEVANLLVWLAVPLIGRWGHCF